MSWRSALCGSVVMWIACLSARADWTLTTFDLKEQPHLNVNTWDAAEGLSATDQYGKLVKVPTRDMLFLASGKAVATNPGAKAWKLALRNGDVLYGQAAAVSGKSLLFQVDELGPVAIPLKRIASLNAPGNLPAGGISAARPNASDHDVVFFKEGGDRLEGLFAGIDYSKVQFLAQGAQEPTDIAIARIDAVFFGGIQPPRSVPPLSIRMTLAGSASTLTVPLDAQSGFSWSVQQSIAFHDASDKEHTVKADSISRLDILGGRIVFLTELDPEREDQVSFLGTPWPYQINRNVLGLPLHVGRTSYEHGIGVHTQSTLLYALDGSFDTLSLRIGLDDSAAPNGEASARIVLDGKTLWERKNLKPGAISEEISLPIRGGKTLELHADPASRLDVQGRVDWINVMLLRN